MSLSMTKLSSHVEKMSLSSTSQDSSGSQFTESNSVDVIDQNLFLGDKNAATDLELLARLDISHILTAELIPLPQLVTSTFPNMAIMQVPVPDMPEADLLSQFEPAVRFIAEGVRCKGILVHCYHGVSRSASLIAAYLMKMKKLQLDNALDFIRSKRPCIEPNDGFLKQLQLYERMACKLDANYKPYKFYKLVHIYNNVKHTKILPTFHQIFDEEQLTHPPVVNTSSGRQGMETVYRCKKCRTPIGTSRNVFPHSPRQTQTWVSLMKWDNDSSVECRQGVFMEPIPLTMARVGKVAIDSRMHCLKCDNKLGMFSWVNSVSCGCGGSITPGFVLNLSRVDKCTMRKDVEALL